MADEAFEEVDVDLMDDADEAFEEVDVDLMDEYKEQLYQALCQDEPNWEFVRELIIEHPESLLAWPFPFYTVNPLHLASLKKAPMDIMELIVDRYPIEGLVQQEAEFGIIPLQCAIFAENELPVVELLVRRGAPELREMDESSKWNLLVAAVHAPSTEVLELLIRELGTEMVKVRSDPLVDNMTIFQYVCCDGEPSDVMKVLLRYGGSELVAEDDFRVLFCASSTFKSVAFLKLLVDACPQSDEFLSQLIEVAHFNPHSQILRWLQERAEALKLTWIYKQVREWEPEQMKDCQEKLSKRSFSDI